MATDFPGTGLDNFTNPSNVDKLNNPDHATQHANINDSVEAIEAKVGVNSSAVTTSHDYKLGEVTGSDKAVGKTATQTLTNKTLTTPVISTISNTGTLTLPTSTDTLVGRATTDTLTNKTLSTGSTVDANVTVTEVLKKVYPIGCIYFSTNCTNPATSLGFGTWTAFGAGRVPVGFDAAQTEFDVDEETGGAKTHTLITSEMPAHTHSKATNYGDSGTFSDSTVWTRVANSTATTLDTGSTGGGGAHNNLQPYITVRMWKRTV